MSRDAAGESEILPRRLGDVLALTLNRPTKRNALNADMLSGLHLFIAPERRPAWACSVIIAGAGSTFAAGADIGFYENASADEFLSFTDLARSVCDEIERADIPVIAAVQGGALGGGFELALACHWIVAADTAFFGLPELRLGLIPGWGGTQRLTLAVGQRRAFTLIAEGARLGAEQGFELGVVNEIASDADLMRIALERGRTLGAAPRRALVGLRRAVLQAGTSAGYATERTELAAAFADVDAREGISAFLSKRAPTFGR